MVDQVRTGLANRALMNIGHSRLLTDVDTDDSMEARTFRAVYDVSRQTVASAVDWNFNSRRVSLAAAGTAPTFDFLYQYPVPADCLRVTELFDLASSAVIASTSSNPFDDGMRWRVETIGETDETYTKVLVCDLPAPIGAVYLRDVESLARWSPAALEALELKISARLAMPIAKKRELARDLSSDYDAKIALAASIDAREASDTRMPEGSWVNAREGY
ncbi:hypothetical protein [Hyphomonas sp. UBA4494]|jgi:hypothetical protein|uniref:hypothetical protein n=1 Tax=Hyphomonas sp. UBA4494 TaxID=1946631 RepID=UPI0025BC2CD7|nr:hypothetical protein [Hyphomonas sp. UBA4494]